PAELHTLSLHDALPILVGIDGAIVYRRGIHAPGRGRVITTAACGQQCQDQRTGQGRGDTDTGRSRACNLAAQNFPLHSWSISARSEEHTSELQSRENLV